MCSAAMLLWAVSCSESEPAAELPGTMPDTVIIGCAGVGAEIESRTELDADGVSVQWVSGDEIRLWARPSESDAAFTVANVPFRFDYFSPSRSRAGFTGSIPDVENLFTANSYDYYAITPVPADENLDGTLATFTIPAVQTGRFDPAADIMTARLAGAAPLKAGDNNPYIRLEFEHHIHVLKFTIPSSKLLGDIVAVELEFEKPVVGTLQVDAAGEQPDNTEGIDQNTLRLEFPKGEEKHAGDTFYAIIAPTSFEAEQTIVMRVMAGRSETSVHYAFNKPREFAAGHTTPIELNVPKADTRYTVVSFKVSDVRPDGPQESRYGENTLGERVQQFMLTGAEGAFSNAVSMMPTGYCEVPEDANGTKLICTIPSEEEATAIGFDGTYTLTFVSYKTETSTCPYEKWDKTPISGQLLPVEYFSERAWIRSVDNWDPIQTDDAVPEIDDGGEYSVALTIPYLFKEDFSNVSSFSDHDNAGTTLTDTGNNDQFDIYQKYGCLYGWSGQRVGAEAGVAVRVCLRAETFYGSTASSGRLDTPAMLYLKEGVSASLKIDFDYSMHIGGAANRYKQHYFALGVHTEQGVQSIGGNIGHSFGDEVTVITSNEYSRDANGDYDDSGTFNIIDKQATYTQSGCTNLTRFAWVVYVNELQSTAILPVTYYNNQWLYLDNIKVQLVPQE